ncbi:hypothetical protein [Amycolatopsis sp. NPDC006125]|uniref:hypothetical protein n=1 Tax=Amycolatopsis sp. NPDC006125 TaxID=3156730 RepID=UPI0033A0AE87
MISGRIVAARGARPAFVLAGLRLTAGTGLPVAAGSATPVWFLVLGYLLFGAGFGRVGTPIAHTALSGMPRDQAGVAGAIASTCRRTGAAIGVAVCGSILAGGTAGSSRAAGLALAGCAAATVLVGLLSTARFAHAGRGGPEPAA